MKIKFNKSLLCLILTFAMLITNIFTSVIGTGMVYAEEKNSKHVTVRIEANDHTIVPKVELDVDAFDLTKYGGNGAPDSPRVINAIIKALESKGIDCTDGNKFNCGGGNYIDNIDGLKTFSTSQLDGWGYYVDNVWAPVGVGDFELKDGQDLVMFFQEDYNKNIFSYFNVDELNCNENEQKEIVLTGSHYDMYEGKTTVAPVEGAKILVDDKPLIVNGNEVTTNSEGKAKVSFSEPGKRIISAEKVNSDGKRILTRPYCEVTVKENDDEKPAEDNRKILVRVEGDQSTLFKGEVEVGTSSTVLDMLVKAVGEDKVTIVDSQYGKYVSQIHDLKEEKYNGYDGWCDYLVKNDQIEIPMEAMEQQSLENVDEIVFYYCSKDYATAVTKTYIQKSGNDYMVMVASQSMDSFSGTPIEGVDIKIKGVGNYKTDSQGTAIFTLPKGKYEAEFSKYVEGDGPGIVKQVMEIDNSEEEVPENDFIISRIGKGSLALGEDANIKISVTNNKDEDKSAVLVIALYDVVSGEMKSYNYVSKTIKGNETEELAGGFLIPSEGKYKAKAMVWDSLNNMKPLADAMSIEVK